jgi:hypothetical protein
MGLLFLALGAAIFLMIYNPVGNFDPDSPKDWVAAGFIAVIALLSFGRFYFQLPLRIHKRDRHGIWLRDAGRRFRDSLRPLELGKSGSSPKPPDNPRPAGEL